jgi:UDP-3-O-[3-hydroxymyristoyl] glucosamine N-acyltransferase
MTITVRDIANLVNGQIIGDADAIISAPSKIEEGLSGTISFLSNPKYESYLYTTQASAVLIQKDFHLKSDINSTLILVDNVQEAFGILLHTFNHQTNNTILHSNLSSVRENVTLGKNTQIGDFTVIKSNAIIGDNCIIHDQVYIGEQVVIGDHTIIYPGVKIYHSTVIGSHCIIHSNTVLGSDGFGFSPNKEGSFTKIPQIGNVVIEDNVEIGANCVIDRATLGSTVIKKGVKLDNLIQIAHNVTIGSNTVIAAQTGVAGSTSIGENCLIGGQVGIAGHIKIANNTMIQAKSGISGDITQSGRKLYGYPALDYQNYLKSYAYFKNLDKLVDKIRKLEKELDLIKAKNENNV